MPTKPFLRAAMEKALVDMSADLLAHAKAPNPYRGLSPPGLSIGKFEPTRWPYGTIVENTKGTHTLMVVRDDGDMFVAMQLKGSFIVGGAGRVAPGWPKRLHVVVEAAGA